MKCYPLFKFFAPLCLLTFLGAGCLSSSTTASNGGLWKTIDAGTTWTALAALPQASGVGTIGGVNVTALEIDPADTSVFYLGTSQNGIFYSTDYAATWQRPEDDYAKEGAVVDIEVDSRNTCVVYVMKTDRILKSTDCARSFDTLLTETREDEAFTTMALDWYNPDILWSGTSAGDVQKSINGGANWSTVYRLSDDVTDIVVYNGDSRVILVGSARHGLYRSQDGGASWTEFEDSFEDYRDGDRIYGFDQTANGGKILMNTKYGLFVSKDRGVTWEPFSLITSPGEVRIWGMAMHPTDGDTISYATGGTFYQSTNGGTSWLTQELPSSRMPTILKVHPDAMDVLYVGFNSVED
ncbi:MAG: hypothetical protein WC730_03080 [Patescibacteria group bacterium]|jgi:photosystem II stability/assembly factor-like uncharacterized protein